MKRFALPIFFFLLFIGRAEATRGIYISENNCTDITSPETNLAWCADSTAGILKRWNGSTWVATTFTSVPIGASQGGTGIDTSASNGLPSVNAGAWIVNLITSGGYAKGGPNNTITFQTTPIPISDGGTGQTAFTAGYIKNGAGVFSSQTVPIPITDGGTGATAITPAAGFLGSNSLVTLTANILAPSGKHTASIWVGNSCVSSGCFAYNYQLTAGTGITLTVGPSAVTITNTLAVLTTKGDLLTWSTAPARLPVGSDGQVLTAASGQASGVQWVAPITPFGLKGSGSGNYTTVSTTYVDIDATNLKVTVTTTATSKIVVWVKYTLGSSTSTNSDVAILVDGAQSVQLQHINNGTQAPAGLYVRYEIISGLSAASHTVSLGWRSVDAVTLTMANNATSGAVQADTGTTAAGVPEIIVQVIG